MSRVYEMQNTPPVADYVRALTALSDRVTDEHRTLFRVHYKAPDRTATAKQLATWANLVGGWTTVNSRYGKLGHATLRSPGDQAAGHPRRRSPLVVTVVSGMEYAGRIRLADAARGGQGPGATRLDQFSFG